MLLSIDAVRSPDRRGLRRRPKGKGEAMPLRAVLLTAVLAMLVGAPTALAAPPVAVTTAATNITPIGALLNGTVDPKGQETSAYFQYGATTKYTKKTTPGSVGAGVGPVPIYFGINGLKSNTTYHFRVVGTSKGGTHFGKDRTLKTASPTSTPVFTPNPVTWGETAFVSGQIIGSDVSAAQVSLFGRAFPFTDPLKQIGNTVLADSQGNYLFVLPAVLTTSQFEVQGKTSPAFTSSIQTLQVASKVTLGVAGKVRKGRAVRFHGVVQPPQDGTVVVIQKLRRNGTFANFATTTLTHRNDGFSGYSVRKRLGGTHTFRAVVESAGGAVVPGVSPTRTVRVTRR
jgi:hypothetical protein